MTDASELLDQTIRQLGDWRGETLAEVRRIILAADPDIVEEWKWVMPTSPWIPVWTHHRRHLHRRDLGVVDVPTMQFGLGCP